MLSSFNGRFDTIRHKPVFGLDRANRPIFYLDAGLSNSYPGSGTTWTDIYGGSNGTLTNSPTFNTDRFTFDGTNDHVAMPSGFADFTNGITCFFVANFGSANNWERLLDFGADTNSNSNDHILFTRRGTTDDLSLELYNGDGQAISLSFTATGGILNNELASYAVTLDGTNAYMYRNGVQIATTATSVLPSNVERTYNYIGRSNWTSDSYFAGDIAVAMLFNRALTADQIASNHNYFAQRYYIDSQYTVESFTSSTTWTPPLGVTEVEYLVVGGGGGGGTGYDNAGAGGGGGGMVRTGVLPVSRSNRYTITVGAGGAGGADTRANNNGSSGQDSVFGPITSLGGGFGKGCRTNSGTGEAAQVGITTAPVGGDGNGGGFDGAGGGGATGAGGAGGASPGAAGAGLASSISGSSVTYGAGGAGGYNGGPFDGASGTANTGTGGGGGSSPSSNSAGGGTGGSGIVILKYAPIVAPVSTDLIYHLDASNTDSYPTTGTAVSDLTGTYGDATLSNGPVFTQSGAGSYWTFDGSNDILWTPDLSASFASLPITLEVWLYTTSDNGVIISEQGTSPINSGYHTSVMEIVSGDLKCGFWSGIDQTLCTPGAVTRNEWQLYTMTYNGTTLTGYINGGSSASVNFTKVPPTTVQYYALMQSDATNMGDGSYLAGRIGAFRVYNSALTAAEVLQNFNSERARFGV